MLGAVLQRSVISLDGALQITCIGQCIAAVVLGFRLVNAVQCVSGTGIVARLQFGVGLVLGVDKGLGCACGVTLLQQSLTTLVGCAPQLRPDTGDWGLA